MISKKDLYILRKQKVQKEIEAARRLINNKIDILEIADKFIHNTFEIVKEGIRLGVDFSLTSSCYNPSINGAACGVCDSCRLREKGFSEAVSCSGSVEK